MLKKLIKVIIAIVKQLAIAFFFATFIVVFISVFAKDEIDTLSSVINMISVVEKEAERVEVKYDTIKKKLANYPSYGTVWAKIIIPDININLDVKHGDDLATIKDTVGHYAGSYFPGEGGTIIIPGHNNRFHFGKLPKLKVGALITIEADYGTFTYKVYKTDIIGEYDDDKLPIQKEEEILMLYTCYPVSGLGHKDKRFVVYAKLESATYKGESNEKEN